MKNLIVALVWGGVIGAALVPVSAFAQEKDLVFYGIQLEELEYRRGDDGEKIGAWNGDAFVGTDEVKLRWQGEGEYDTDASSFETLENRLAVQVPVSEFFDIKGGVRYDSPKGPNRWYGVLGLSGLAPQWFEIDADLFVSEKGDVSARLDVEYELLLTNRLILTPSAEIDVAFSDDEPVGVGSGLSSAGLGLRLSYDLVDRAVSPYIGVAYERKFGNTADFARAEGEAVDGLFGVIGVRLLF